MVNLKNVSHDKTIGNSRLEFDLSGPEINHVILNTLRRVILSDIPIYAFTDFKFNKNDSIFHNNFLKNQIKNMPVWGINNKIDFYEPGVHTLEVIEDQEEMEDNVDLTYDKKVDATSLNQVTMYVDYENKKKDIVSITTDDAKFYFAQKQINNPYDKPIQLVKLQPDQKINFSVLTSIGIEKNSAIFSPVSICVYDQKSENEFRFILESRGQIDEKRILKVGYLNLIKKLNNILNQISESDKQEEKEGELQINNEDHTMGNLLSHGLQVHKNVQFAGYHMPHPLETRVIISYKLKSGKFKEILKQVIEDFIEVFNKIDKLMEKTL
jgi:DNA-directed RNA polymerase subunit L